MNDIYGGIVYFIHENKASCLQFFNLLNEIRTKKKLDFENKKEFLN